MEKKSEGRLEEPRGNIILENRKKLVLTGAEEVIRVYIMRLDKYLKVSRIIKRRTVAKEVCEGDRVSINGKVAKPSTTVKEGDIIEIQFANRSLKAKIVNIVEHVKKENAKEMYEILEGEEDKE